MTSYLAELWAEFHLPSFAAGAFLCALYLALISILRLGRRASDRERTDGIDAGSERDVPPGPRDHPWVPKQGDPIRINGFWDGR